MGEINQVYTIGQRVVGTVERVFPFGAFVRLADGTRAYIRRRELSLASDVAPGKLMVEGDQLKAVALILKSQAGAWSSATPPCPIPGRTLPGDFKRAAW